MLFFVCAVDSFTNFKYKKQMEWFVFGTTLLLMIIRFPAGMDTNDYIFRFKQIQGFFDTDHGTRNLGFAFLEYSVKTFTDDYRVFALIFNAIVNTLILSTIYKYSKQPLLSLCIYVMAGFYEVYSCSALRQGMAMAIFFFAFYRFLSRKQIIAYEICCLTAFLFHDAALISFFIPLLFPLGRMIKKNPKTALFVTVFIAVFAYSFLLFGFPKLLPLIQSLGFNHQFFAYMISFDISVIGILMQLCFLFALLFLYFSSRSIEPGGEFESVQFYVVLGSIILYLVLSMYSQTSRMTDFYQIIMIILFADLFHGITDRKRKALGFLGILALNSVLLLGDIQMTIARVPDVNLKHYSLSGYPYMTVWNEDIHFFIDRAVDFRSANFAE